MMAAFNETVYVTTCCLLYVGWWILSNEYVALRFVVEVSLQPSCVVSLMLVLNKFWFDYMKFDDFKVGFKL